jgi:hypothetical protein
MRCHVADDEKCSPPVELAQIQNSFLSEWDYQGAVATLSLSILRPDRKISEGHSDNLAIHFPQCRVQFQEMGAAKFQLVLVRLIDSANRVI